MLNSLEDHQKSRTTLVAEVGQLRSELAALRDEYSRAIAEQESVSYDNERLKFQVQNSPLAVIEWALDPLRISIWSAQAERLFGWNHQEATDQPLDRWQFIYEKDLAKIKQYFAALVANDDQQHNAVLIRSCRNDGALLHCEWYNSILCDAHGQPEAIQSLILDVTDRVHAGKDLHQASQLLSLLTDSIPEIVFLKDLESRYLAMSKAGADFLGKTVDDIIGKTDDDLFPAADVSRIKADDRHAFKGKSWRFRETVINGAGEKRLMSTAKAPFRDTDDKIVGVFAISRDISNQSLLRQRGKQQAALAKFGQRALAEDDLQVLMNDLVEGIAKLLDAEYCKVLELLPEGKNLLLRAGVGWREGLVGHATVGAGLDSQAGYTLHSEQPVVVTDLRQETRFSSSPLLHQHGVTSGLSCIIGGHGPQPYGVLGAYTKQPRKFSSDDVNFLQTAANILGSALRQQRTEKALQDLNSSLEHRVAERTAELEAFAYTVSHDLREPLRVMRSFADALLEDHGDGLNQTAQHYLARIIAASERMNALISDLLSYSQLNQQELTLTSVALSKVVEDVLQYLAKEIKQSEARIEIEKPLPFVRTHRPTLERVIQNLVSNALKFIQPTQTPHVRIVACREDEQIELSIIDQGLGIAAEHQERIFDVFERLHSSDQYPGTGAGLAIVRRAMQRMSGECGVESEHGKGSRFWIRLPNANRDAENV